MVGFILLVAAVPVAAYYVLKWYAYDNWIVTAQGDQIVVKQGQPGGVLWFHPKVVDRTGVTTEDILPAAIAPVRSGVQRPSLQSAKSYVVSVVTTHHHDDHHHDDHDAAASADHHDAATPATTATTVRHDAHRPVTTTTAAP